MHENLRQVGWMCEWLSSGEAAQRAWPLLDYMAHREEEERARISSQAGLTSHR